MSTNEVKPQSDRTTGSEAAGEPNCFQCVHSMPDFTEGYLRLQSAYQENRRSALDEAYESFVRVWENEAISRYANSLRIGFDETGDIKRGVGDEEAPSEPNWVCRIYTVKVGEDVCYRLRNSDGTVDGDWGLEGIESLIEKHVGGEDDPFYTNFALHFYRETHDVMRGDYVMVADIDDDTDVINIRVIRGDEEELRYPNRFIFFESSSWWNAQK
ncbi:hypothetical protein [Pararhizobium arenae]|uniref:hypothetical protein n=1 Tax=Pararhizobium arenae TaxID=1856850 RepID=UPI000AFFD550|nr:hypothetical protein [Pararhizobium arenae]